MIESLMKSYRNKDPLVAYTMQHSLRQTDVQKRLDEVTLKHRRAGMLGAPEVLQLNANLMQAIGAKKVLDVGVFTGASSLSAALALPADGEVHSLDLCEEYVNIGKPFWEEAGVTNKIHLHIAPAGDTLQKFIQEGRLGTFDFAFIDADKVGYDNYYECCLKLIRPGGIIAFDNTLWDGNVINSEDQSEDTVALRKLNEKLRDDQRINISFLKIGDGLTLCFKK
ncbi:probable caffeoyl-CoA O-methyltransferase 2 isoform X1 [Macrobrachium nipponense]|uniref:probable caffeoyl-CoA O-methyltransferase 2 isoform X1 n=1 Tax=Macrobrachium nipponense TaxID=159736 RepID=UPI0030C82E0A